MAVLGPAPHGVARALARLLALDLRGEADRGEQELVLGGVQHALAVVEVEPDADARVGDLLQRVGRLDLLAPEARLLGHDEDLERRARPEGVQEPRETWSAIAEHGAAHAIVRVDVPVGDRPALLLGVGAGVLDLPRDALGLVGDAVLLGALAGIDCCDHLVASD